MVSQTSLARSESSGHRADVAIGENPYGERFFRLRRGKVASAVSCGAAFVAVAHGVDSQAVLHGRGRKSANDSCMTPDERAQLVEDIKMAGSKRRDIAERAAMDNEFDVAAAWEELDELDKSINKRVVKSRKTE
jgi:hypothetical protein